MVYRPRIDDKLCFVLMPFRDPFNGHYEHIIKKVVRAAGLEPLRGDEVFGTRSIIRDVWEHIWRARVVIADVTDRNPNVNYELGLCHSLGVSTILITQRIEDVPFDYRHRRCIVYHTEEATWIEKLSKDLESTLRTVLSENEDDQELRWPYDTFVLKQMVGTNTTISIENPRQIIIRGMADTKHLVSRAFGPCGINVSVTLSSHRVVSHKQGLAIAQGIHSANPIEENGIEQMRQVGRYIARVLGDGTKTAMILTQALVEFGQDALGQGQNLRGVLKGIEKGIMTARSSIVASSRVSDSEDLSAVALTASGDQQISKLVLSAIEAAGRDGVILMETKLGEMELAVQEGLRFDRGYLSDKFITNPATGECEFTDCHVLVHELKISNMRDLLPLLEEVARDGAPLLVIAENVEDEALATLVVNNVRGTIRCAAVRAPGSGDRRKALLQDIAVLTGAKVIAADLGPRLEAVRLVDLGMAQKVVVTKDETTVFGGHGTDSAVQAHIGTLRAAIDRSHDPHEREKLQERLANLAGKIAIIRVGGTTEVDAEERRYRALSAMHSARAAMDEGWSYGGGITFLNARASVEALTVQTPDEASGVSIVSKALETPFFALAESCQKSPVGLLSELQRLAQPAMGLNVETGNMEDMRALGILDPTKTLCWALDVAHSYARAILKTDIWSVSPAQPEEGTETSDVAF